MKVPKPLKSYNWKVHPKTPMKVPKPKPQGSIKAPKPKPQGTLNPRVS